MEIVRYNNPGNIMQHTGTRFLGECASPHRRLTAFKSITYGVRAIVKILRTYRANGFTSYRAMIRRYAPPTENNTEAYIRFVCQQCGSLPTDRVTDAQEYNLVAAICWYESHYRLTSGTWTAVKRLL